MAVDAVIFDWGGTLTPWHTIDATELCAAALHAPERQLWRTAEQAHRSATMAAVFELAGVSATAEPGGPGIS